MSTMQMTSVKHLNHRNAPARLVLPRKCVRTRAMRACAFFRMNKKLDQLSKDIQELTKDIQELKKEVTDFKNEVKGEVNGLKGIVIFLSS